MTKPWKEKLIGEVKEHAGTPQNSLGWMVVNVPVCHAWNSLAATTQRQRLGPKPLHSFRSNRTLLDSRHTPRSLTGRPDFLTADFHPRVDPRFSIAESHKLLYSIKQFIHGAATQKQPELVPLRRDPKQRNPWGCCTFTLQVSSFPPDSSDPDVFLSVWSLGWATGPHVFCNAIVRNSYLGLKMSAPIFLVGPLQGHVGEPWRQ